ncbi:MAG TPA: amino acid permease [Gemmatimonadales bacterium]|nr:amino acid permease [Gemmatimonadales bacterium]
MFDGVSIVVGITIGAGIFSTPQIIAGYHSSFTWIAFYWILGGLLALVGGLVYAELGTRLPETGGEYVYLTRCFGPYMGFIFGWAQLFIIRTSPGAGLAIITANYLGFFVPLTDTGKTLVALGTIAALGTLNYIGIQWAAFYQRPSSVLKACGLLLLAVVGLAASRGEPSLLATTAPPTATLGPLGNASAAFLLIVFSYLGWDRLGYVAGEMKNPRRVLPPSLVVSMATVAVLYLLTNVMYHHVLGMEGVRASTIVASDAMIRVLGPIGAGLVAALVIVSTTGSINGTVTAAPRVYYAMARDGLFFKWLDYVHPRFRTPSRAIVVHCVWAAVILLVRQNFEHIVAGMTFAILIFYAFTTIALFRLRREGVGGPDVFKVPGYPVVPLLYLVGIVALILFRLISEPVLSLVDLAFIATGLPFALVWCRGKGGKAGRR